MVELEIKNSIIGFGRKNLMQWGSRILLQTHADALLLIHATKNFEEFL